MNRKPHDPDKNPKGYLDADCIPIISGYQLIALTKHGATVPAKVTQPSPWTRKANLEGMDRKEIVGWYPCKQS